jgi:hypothetical protein
MIICTRLQARRARDSVTRAFDDLTDRLFVLAFSHGTSCPAGDDGALGFVDSLGGFLVAVLLGLLVLFLWFRPGGDHYI